MTGWDIVVEEWITTALAFAVPIIEACGASIIIVEVFRTFFRYLWGYLPNRYRNPNRLRIRLGQSMVIGLEFQVAADILKTALSPQWNDILLLGALIGLRTLLNYLMEKELERLDANRALSTGYARPTKDEHPRTRNSI
jgi:uncharacterized membrane protein